MKVVVAASQRYHAFDLARELERQGALARLITSYPKFMTRRAGVGSDSVTSLLPVEVYRRARHRMSPEKRRESEGAVESMFARLTSLALPAHIDVFVGWSGSAGRALCRARARGALGVVQVDHPHIELCGELSAAAYEQLELPPRNFSKRRIERRLAEYDEADSIAVSSSFAFQSFIDRGFTAAELLLNPIGCDLEPFTPAEQPPDAFRILYVGPIDVHSGAAILLQAFHELQLPGAELVLIGRIDDEVEPLRQRFGGRNVFWLGERTEAELPTYFQRASVYCQPTIVGRMSQHLLQALVSGVAPLLTPNSGGRSLIVPGESGQVAAAGDVEALKAGLVQLYGAGVDGAFEMGQLGVDVVHDGFSWRDYGWRARQAYLERLQRPGQGGPVITARRPGMTAAPRSIDPTSKNQRDGGSAGGIGRAS